MTKEESQKRLQELLVIAQGALDVVKDFALENDLCFSFAGLRRGPIYNGDYAQPISVEDVAAYPDDYEDCKVEMSVLDYGEEWLGSWSPGCG